jgi:hypothetical protein
MPERNDLEEFAQRANEVRSIAAGIYDHAERALVLNFVNECEIRIGIAEKSRPAPSAVKVAPSLD